MSSVRIMLAVLIALGASNISYAEEYPAEPVRLIIPFAAGGPTDIVGRIIAEKMATELDQQVIVENRPGATGAVAARHVAGASPDGYTLMVATFGSHVLVPLLSATSPYDPVEDFTPISLLTTSPLILTANPDFPADDLNSAIQLLQESPGAYFYASSGVGAPTHLAAILMEQQLDVDMTHVPYPGSGPALQAIIGGEVQLMFDAIPSSRGPVDAGQLNALAVTSPERIAFLPDVPTMRELGLPELESYTWTSMVGPKGLSNEVVGRLNSAVASALSDPELVERLQELGSSVAPTSAEDLRLHMNAQIDMWRPVAEASGAELD